jgi:2-desacetyl-2-hydroxyethyl bacteriochlorophyllide A dehydrogenase
MQAWRWHGRHDLRLDEVVLPRPQAGQALIAVERVGLCGTDLDEYRHGPLEIPVTRPHPLSGQVAPITLGHEVVGTVEECPGGEVEVGTRVIPDAVLGCGECWWCHRHQPGQCPNLAVRGLQADGGLADYLLVEAHTLVPVPDSVSADVAAFAEPTAVAVRALRKAADLTGTTIAVVGAGTIGLLVTAIATATAARQVLTIDPLEQRREHARRHSAIPTTPEHALETLRAVAGARGADIVVECAGQPPAVELAFQLCRTGGRIVLVGTGTGTPQLPTRDVVLREQHILGSAAHVWDEDVTAAIALLSRGVIDPSPLLTATVAMSHTRTDGFDRLGNDPDAIKIIVAPRQ